MQKNNGRITEQEFNELFLAALDETLSSLGENAKTAIYLHLEQKFNLRIQEIPNNIERFTSTLEKLFGLASKSLEVFLMQRLHSKIKSEFNPTSAEDLTFPKYVSMIKKEIVSPGVSAKNLTIQPYGNEKDKAYF